MSSISDDTSAQLHMLMDAYKNLKKINPNHKLLGLAEMHPDEGGFDFTSEYAKKYVRKHDTWKVQGYARYTEELKDALREESQLEKIANHS
jgi:hypothetical protein